MKLDDILQASLSERREQSLYRQRAIVESPQQVVLSRGGKSLISFCSNDYLGLANHPKVIEAFHSAAKKYGVGSGASHLVNGHSYEHHALEEELASFMDRARAVLFSTGYMANLGVINALTNRNDAVFEDKLNHASLLDGGLLSQAKMVRFQHNNVHNLEQQLRKTEANRKLIVVDGVFSMDGDFADLPALAEIASKNSAWLMVDDAHGIGCVGENGKGTLEQLNLNNDDVPILIGTLGKAFGTFGAFVSGSEVLIETLIQFARTYIYTTALPPAVAAASRASLLIIQNEPERRQNLQKLIGLFRDGCKENNLPLISSSTAIQPLQVGDAKRALQISQKLEEKGFWVTAIRPPTVPQGTARLRITLSAAHTTSQVESLVEVIAEVCGD